MLDNLSISIKGLKGFMKMLLFNEKITARAWIFFILVCGLFLGFSAILFSIAYSLAFR